MEFDENPEGIFSDGELCGSDLLEAGDEHLSDDDDENLSVRYTNKLYILCKLIPYYKFYYGIG